MIHYKIKILMLAASMFLWSCKKDSAEISKLELKQLGADNFKPSIYGIKGFSHNGVPIVHHSLNFLYLLDEESNTFNRIGNTIPNPAQVANAKIVQDAVGNYFYHSGSQGEIFLLNKSSNKWDTAFVATGYKNQMIANAKGDILVYIDNTPIGGVESFYKKNSTSTQWKKVADMPKNNPKAIIPQFLSNDGIAFFNLASAPTNQIDGAGGYMDVVLNTHTGEFGLLFDKSATENFPVTEAYNYESFMSSHTSPDGVFYAIRSEANKASLYKLDSKTLPAKFTKVQDIDLAKLEEGGYQTLRQLKINEATNTIKCATSCQLGTYSHKNLGVVKLKSSAINILSHDGPQRLLIANPNGIVYIHDWEGYLFKWE